MTLTGMLSAEIFPLTEILDREVQAPTWGYPTEGAYYRDASSCDSVLAVRIPLFAINAKDDPVSLQGLSSSRSEPVY